MGKFFSFLSGALAGAGVLAAASCIVARLTEREPEEAVALKAGAPVRGDGTDAASAGPDTVNA